MDHDPHGQPGRVRKVMNFVANRPEVAYGSLCGTFVAVFVLWIALIIALGTDFLPFESDVPLYLRGNTARQRLDAVAQGKELSDVALNMPDVQLRRVADTDVDNKDLTFEILWEPASGNMFAERHLRRMVEIESRLIESEGFQTGCLLEWPQEADDIEQQAASSGDPGLYDQVRAMNNGTGPYKGTCRYPDSLAWGCARPHPETGCEDIMSFPPGILDCRRAAGCTAPAHFEPLNMTFASMKIGQYANTNPFSPTAPGAVRQAYAYIDSAFGSGNAIGRALRSQFRFGIPIDGYLNIQDNLKGQTEQVSKHIWKHFSGFLGNESTSELNVQWQGYGMSGQLIAEQLPKDGAFALGSMMFVLVYSIFTLQSAFSGVMGVGQIVMGFAPAYILYYAVFQQRYFGVFNVLSIFIILGIGADNIFVMMDAWGQSKGDTASRLAYTWKRSAGALAVTSVTTMASFLSNATSSFPAIQTFGIFAALLVFVNYCAVITYYISVVSFNEKYFAAKEFCCGCVDAVVNVLVQPRDKASFRSHAPTGGARRVSAPGVTTGTGDDIDTELAPVDAATDSSVELESPRRVAVMATWLPPLADATSLSELGRVEQWFHNTFSIFVIRWRVLIVLVFHIVLGFFISQAVTLDPDPNPPQFFPESSTYQSYFPNLASYFQRGGSVFALKQQLVWGFDAEMPIDRAGTRSSSIQDRGAPVYDPAFRLSKASECIIQICDAAEIPNDLLGLGGAPEYPVLCSMRDFKRWFLAGKANYNASAASAEWAAMTDVNGDDIDEQTFLLTYGAFLVSDPNLLELYKPLGFGEYDGDEVFSSEAVRRFANGIPVALLANSRKVIPRFVMATLKLTAERTIPFDIGIDMFKAWEKWWEQQYSEGACLARREHAPGFHNTQGEYLGWDYFFVQEKLVGEAFAGIGISLLLALVVLTIATHNFYIGMLSTLIITEIVLSVIAFAVLVGWKLGILESICFVMVPGMSVDYVAHLAEAYNESTFTNRQERVRDMLTKVGVSVLSGAFSTLGATLFLFFPLIVFFVKFGTFIFITISYSLVFSLFNFSALMALFGPQEHDGDFVHFFKTRCGGKEGASVTQVQPKATPPRGHPDDGIQHAT